MSVYSYIKVYKPGEEGKEDNPHLGFGHGVPWYYLIAVANGKRSFGVTKPSDSRSQQSENVFGFSIYELPVVRALDNYRVVIQTLGSLIELDTRYSVSQQFYHDLGLITVARNWLEQAQQRIPSGIVKFDWCERAWYLTQEEAENWDVPNNNFKLYADLSRDCKKFINKHLTLEDFQTKYPEYGSIDIQSIDVEDIPF